MTTRINLWQNIVRDYWIRFYASIFPEVRFICTVPVYKNVIFGIFVVWRVFHSRNSLESGFSHVINCNITNIVTLEQSDTVNVCTLTVLVDVTVTEM